MNRDTWIVKTADGRYVYGCLQSTTRDASQTDLLAQGDAERLAAALNQFEQSALSRAVGHTPTAWAAGSSPGVCAECSIPQDLVVLAALGGPPVLRRHIGLEHRDPVL